MTRSKVASGAAAETECTCPLCVIGHSTNSKITSPYLIPGKPSGRPKKPEAATTGGDAAAGPTRPPPSRPPPPRPPPPRPPPPRPTVRPSTSKGPAPPPPQRPGPSSGMVSKSS